MRACGAGAGGAAAGAHQHDRLAGCDDLARRAREGATVAEVLHVQGDQTRLLVQRDGGQEIGRVDVGLIAHGGEARDPEAVGGQKLTDLEREVAALRDQRDRAFAEACPREPELRVRVGDPQAVRAEQQGARVADPRYRLLLAPRSLGPGLAQPRANRDDGAGSRRDGRVDGVREAAGRHRNSDEIGRRRQLGKGTMSPATEDLPSAAIHEIHRPAMLARERTLGEHVSPLPRCVGGADDGHRPGSEQRAEVPMPRPHSQCVLIVNHRRSL